MGQNIINKKNMNGRYIYSFRGSTVPLRTFNAQVQHPVFFIEFEFTVSFNIITSSTVTVNIQIERIFWIFLMYLNVFKEFCLTSVSLFKTAYET